MTRFGRTFSCVLGKKKNPCLHVNNNNKQYKIFDEFTTTSPATVILRAHNAIHRINSYAVDKC